MLKDESNLIFSSIVVVIVRLTYRIPGSNVQNFRTTLAVKEIETFGNKKTFHYHYPLLNTLRKKGLNLRFAIVVGG